MTTGQKIAERRKLLGLSQERLGEQVGVSRQAISKWESDAALPEVEKLATLSRLFGVTVGWLLGLEEESGNAQPVESPQLSAEQMELIEEMVKRHAPPKEQQRWKNIPLLPLALVLCACLALWCVGLTGFALWSQHTVGQHLRKLDQRLEQCETRPISVPTPDYEGIYSQLESRLEESMGKKAVLAACELEIVEYQPETNEVRLRLTAVPRYPERIGSEEDISFTALLAGKTYTADSISWDGSTYIAELNVPTEDGIGYFLKLPGEEEVTQVSVADDSHDARWLGEYGSFSIEQLDFYLLETVYDQGKKSSFVRWEADEYGYFLLGREEYYIDRMEAPST